MQDFKPDKTSKKNDKKEKTAKSAKSDSDTGNEQESPPVNMFDLSAFVGTQNDHEVKQAAGTTPEEQEKMLRNYTEVDKATWAAIPMDSHIRYLRKDGAFRRGGFVKNSWVGTYGASAGKKCLQLSAAQSYKSTKWTVCLDDIEKIWKLNSAGSSAGEKNIISPEILTTVQTNKENIEYLMRAVEQLKIDMAKITNEQTRIINLIKKLHNIKTSDRK
jgi:hypothetical protein